MASTSTPPRSQSSRSAKDSAPLRLAGRGDPVEPQRIDYPTLLGDRGFSFLGDANTRDRDYCDVYLLSQIHSVKAESLHNALRSIAEHRGHEVRPLGPLLENLRESRQQTWEAFRVRVGLPGLPERFADVVDAVVYFVDGLQDGRGSTWNPVAGEWE